MGTPTIRRLHRLEQTDWLQRVFAFVLLLAKCFCSNLCNLRITWGATKAAPTMSGQCRSSTSTGFASFDSYPSGQLEMLIP